MSESCYGLTLSASNQTTPMAWRAGLEGFFLLLADPMAHISQAIDTDPTFVMGPVIRAAYTVLGGSPIIAPSLLADLALAQERKATATSQEQRHVDAVTVLAGHDFSAAGAQWDAIVRDHPDDLLAARIAHDIYLHVGNDEAKLLSLTPAIEVARPGSHELGLLKGMLAFAYEELGRYEEAENEGWEALAINDGDIWAVHALAHVFEMQGRSDDSLALLSSAARWTTHELLSNHLWWHRAVRLTAEDRLDEALAIADDFAFDETMAFTLCDYTSLLWRVEERGGNVGDRWSRAVDTWTQVGARHTCGFLDLHAGLAFAAAGSPVGTDWHHSLDLRVQAGNQSPAPSENDEIFRDVAKPLYDNVLNLRNRNRPEAIAAIKTLAPIMHRIGGSRAQRQVVDLSIATPQFGVHQ